MSTLPINTAVMPLSEEYSNTTAATTTSSSSTSSCHVSSSSVPCVFTVHGAITVETFYSRNKPQRRRQQQQGRSLDESTSSSSAATFSDPLLLERIGSLLTSFFQTNRAVPNSTFTTAPSSTTDHNNDPSYDWNTTFVAITNFVSENQPFPDTFTIHTNDKSNNETVPSNAIDQASKNQTTIDKSVGIIAITIAITALVITILLIGFRNKRTKK